MGASQSCSLCPDESPKTEVRVMKEDGEDLRFRKGTSVREVLAAYPYHKLVRCCSDRTVLSESVQLSNNSLYFLLPEGLTVSDTTYQSLISTAVSRGLIFKPASSMKLNTENGQQVNKVTSTNDYDDYSGYKKSPWKPALKTITEIASPPVHQDIIRV